MINTTNFMWTIEQRKIDDNIMNKDTNKERKHVTYKQPTDYIMYIILLRKLSFVDRIFREKREIIVQTVHIKKEEKKERQKEIR